VLRLTCSLVVAACTAVDRPPHAEGPAADPAPESVSATASEPAGGGGVSPADTPAEPADTPADTPAEPADTPADTPAEPGDTPADTPAEPAGGLRVRVSLDVTGELVAPSGPQAAAIRVPVEMAARFDFDEVPAEVQPAPAAVELAAADGQQSGEPLSGTGTPPVRRQFRDASASMRYGDTTTRVALEPDARRLLVARRGTTPTPYLADGFLSGDECDLLDTPFDSLLLDDLLPGRPVAVGQTWELPADLTAGLLAIDTVESGGIEARVEEVADGRAKVALTGVIDGAVDGVPTHVMLEGTCTAAARLAPAADGDQSPRHALYGRVTGVSAVIRERRQASHVAPGFAVEARLQVARTVADRSAGEADRSAGEAEGGRGVATAAAAAGLPRRRGAGCPGQVWYRDPQGRFDLVHDTRWRRVEDGANGLVMRLVDRGALVGQCSITTLAAAARSALPGVADVKRDVEQSLAGQVVRVDAERERDRADGLREVRVASSGTAGRLPFGWVHYVIAAADGRRASVTFMFEESMRERFGDADRLLVESLRLPETGPDAVPSPGAGPTAAAIPSGHRPTR